MKKTIIGVFMHREDAEKAINYIHNKLKIPTNEISYLYRNTKDEIRQVDTSEISSDTPREGALMLPRPLLECGPGGETTRKTTLPSEKN